MRTSFFCAVALAASMGIGCAAGDLDTSDQTQLSEVQKDKVIFVHGCYPGPPLAPAPYTNAGAAQFWGPIQQFFLANGYTQDDLAVWVYPGAVCGDIRDMAADLEQFVQANQVYGKKVDIVAHSMAGLTVRYFLKYEGGHDLVNDVAILAGTNHGSDILPGLADYWQSQFGYPAYQGARQMAGAYACRGVAVDDVQPDLNGCLTDTGRSEWANELPEQDDVNYLNIYLSQNDEVNVPADTSCLGQAFKGDCSNPVNVPIDNVTAGPDGFPPAHVNILFDPTVMQMTYDHLQTSSSSHW